MILTNHRERTRFLRFLVVGSIGFVVDFGTFNILSSVFRVPAVAASVLSFITAVTSNFMWNRYWTYPDSRSKRVRRQVLEFGAVSLTGLLIRTPLFALLTSPMEALFTWAPWRLPLPRQVLAHNGALAVSVIVILFWNFFVNRYWTYSDVE